MVKSHLFRQLQRQGDILGLSAFVAAAEQNDQDTPSPTGLTSPGLSSAKRRTLWATSALARTSRKAESHSEKASVSRTSILCQL
jgi:hypothetical protein